MFNFLKAKRYKKLFVMGTPVTVRDICKTFMIFMAWITKGLYLEIAGPTMIDLRLLYKTNYKSITRSVAGRGAGGFLGAVIGALLVDKFEKQLDLCIAIGTTIAGICIALVPHVATIDYVWMLYFVIGGVSSAVNMGGTRIALEIWKEKSSIVLQLLHMGFGVGALMGPLVCSPFLAEIENVQHDEGNPNPHYHVVKSSRVHLAYLAIGIFTCCVAVPFLLFQLTNEKYSVSMDTMPLTSTKPKTLREIINPATYANGNFYYGLSSLFLLFLYFFNLIGGEKVFATFVRTISVDVFHLRKGEASYLNTMFWLSLTFGRLIGAFVARFVHVRNLILIQTILHLASVITLNSYALTDPRIFWCLTIVEGLIISPLYPLGVAYGHTVVNLTGFCLMVIVFAGSVGDLTYLWTAGKMYDIYGPSSVLYAAGIAAWLLVVCVVLFRISARIARSGVKILTVQL